MNDQIKGRSSRYSLASKQADEKQYIPQQRTRLCKCKRESAAKMGSDAFTHAFDSVPVACERKTRMEIARLHRSQGNASYSSSCVAGRRPQSDRYWKRARPVYGGLLLIITHVPAPRFWVRNQVPNPGALARSATWTSGGPAPRSHGANSDGCLARAVGCTRASHITGLSRHKRISRMKGYVCSGIEKGPSRVCVCGHGVCGYDVCNRLVTLP
jgi:hypothetical protein